MGKSKAKPRTPPPCSSSDVPETLSEPPPRLPPAASAPPPETTLPPTQPQSSKNIQIINTNQPLPSFIIQTNRDLSDNDGFIQVPAKRRRNSTASTFSSSSGMSTESRHTTRPIPASSFTVMASNIPPKYSNQKTFYSLLIQLQIKVSSAIVRRGNVAIITSPDPNILNLLAPLKQYSINLSPQDPKTRASYQPSTSFPTLSCVVRNVDESINSEDVLEAIRSQNLTAHQAWRIQSRKTNQPTSMFRILTKCRKTLDSLLTKGFSMYFRHYPCEPSNTPSVQPLQCGRCFAFGHSSTSCRLPHTCPRCSMQHLPSSPCPTPKVTCSNCKGEHPSYSHHCPARPKEITDPTLAAPKKSIDPPAEDCFTSSDESLSRERFARVTDVIRFIHLTLSNIFPLQAQTISDCVTQAARHFFKREVAVTGYGSKLHYSVKRIPPSRDPINPWVRR